MSELSDAFGGGEHGRQLVPGSLRGYRTWRRLGRRFKAGYGLLPLSAVTRRHVVWPPTLTAECTDPDVGASVNIMFETAPKALVANGFAIPSKNVFKIICKYSATQSAQVNVKAWFTGHPNFKHVMVNTIDDARMQGAIHALTQVGRFDDALTIASGADGLGQQQIKAGLEGASIAYFPERYGEWLVPILEDVMAGNPVPSFTGSKLVVITKANINKYYPG